jgi:hypothetical protein
MGLAVRAHGEVGIVTGVVALRTLQSMFLSVRIEMRPSRLEVRGVALRVLVKVDAMFAGRQILKIKLHAYCPGPGFPENRCADTVALGVLELNHSLGRTG